MANSSKSTPPEMAAANPAHAPAVPARADTKVARPIAQLTRAEGASLDQMVTEITGTKWSGPRFFGLRQCSEPPVRISARG
jgi:hypothetical protein